MPLMRAGIYMKRVFEFVNFRNIKQNLHVLNKYTYSFKTIWNDIIKHDSCFLCSCEF